MKTIKPFLNSTKSTLATLLCFSVVSSQAAEWQAVRDAWGNTFSICKSLETRLNNIPKACSADALETAPAFSEPPWERLDAGSHLDLIAKLIKYRSGGSRDHQATGSELEKTIDYIRNDAEAGRIYIDVWHTHLIDFFDSGYKQPAPEGLQTVVRLTQLKSSDPANLNSCPGKITWGWVRSEYFMLPDLSGPDLRLERGLAYSLQNAVLLNYENNTFLVSPDSVSPVLLPAAGGIPVCKFEYTQQQ